MWWMLLTVLESGEYRAEIVVQTFEYCEQLKTNTRDRCIPVTVQFATQPQMGPEGV
jgi:hypothetical protein